MHSFLTGQSLSRKFGKDADAALGLRQESRFFPENSKIFSLEMIAKFIILGHAKHNMVLQFSILYFRGSKNSGYL
jgi:hypothetical protein